ncbi:MAG: beta-glucosidase, partial [Bacteroidetes bacterium HGW-Bacteroidetes-15]
MNIKYCILFFAIVLISSCKQEKKGYSEDIDAKVNTKIKNLSEEELLDKVQKQTFDYFW